MLALERIAEQRIREAVARGELVRLGALLGCAVEGGERARIGARMAVVRARLGDERAGALWVGGYAWRLAERMGR